MERQSCLYVKKNLFASATKTAILVWGRFVIDWNGTVNWKKGVIVSPPNEVS